MNFESTAADLGSKNLALAFFSFGGFSLGPLLSLISKKKKKKTKKRLMDRTVKEVESCLTDGVWTSNDMCMYVCMQLISTVH